MIIAFIFGLTACGSPPDQEPGPELSIEIRQDGIGNDLAGEATAMPQGGARTFDATLIRGTETVADATFTWTFPTGTRRNTSSAPVTGTTVADGVVTIAPNQPAGTLRLNVTASVDGQNASAYLDINVFVPTLAEIFPDENLAQVVADELDVSVEDVITMSELAGITSLFAWSAGIQGLTGVGYLTGLEELDLGGNEISNIESGTFIGLTNLGGVDLEGNQINSLEAGVFTGLTNLEWLGLEENQINSLEVGVFAGLTNLWALGLDGNQISSLKAGIFTGLTNLVDLDLGDNQINNIASGTFAGLTNLMDLQLNDNQISNLAPGIFADLTSLDWLQLGGSEISNIETIADLTSLTSLSLANNRISNVEPIASLTNLRGLSLWNNQISDLRPLANLNLDLLDADNQTINLPTTTVGAETPLYLYLPDGTAIELTSSARFTFDDNSLIWQTPGNHTATWNQAHGIGHGSFSGTIYQTVNPATLSTENQLPDLSPETAIPEVDGTLLDKSLENPLNPNEALEDDEIKEEFPEAELNDDEVELESHQNQQIE